MIESNDLSRIPIFRELGRADLDRIKRLMFERAFRKGSMLFLEGMQGEVFYVVKSGTVEILKKKDNEDILIATLGPGELVGEMSILDDEPRSATARIGEDAVLIVVTKKNFQDIMRETPGGANKILLAILKIVNQRLRETNRKLTSA